MLVYCGTVCISFKMALAVFDNGTAITVGLEEWSVYVN